MTHAVALYESLWEGIGASEALRLARSRGVPAAVLHARRRLLCFEGTAATDDLLQQSSAGPKMLREASAWTLRLRTWADCRRAQPPRSTVGRACPCHLRLYYLGLLLQQVALSDSTAIGSAKLHETSARLVSVLEEQADLILDGLAEYSLALTLDLRHCAAP